MSVASLSAPGLSPAVASEVGDRGGRFLDCAQVCSTLVTLNLYDLSSSWTGLNNVLDTTFAAGAFHTGVVVFGREYYYSGMVADGGAGQRSVSGVYWHEPGEHEVHQFRQSIELGHTSLTPREAQQQMLELSSEWSAPGYHILRRNCVHFAVALCDRLGVGPVPARVCSCACPGQISRAGPEAVRDRRCDRRQHCRCSKLFAAEFVKLRGWCCICCRGGAKQC